MTKSDLYATVKSYLNRPQMPDTDIDRYAEIVRGRLNTALRDHPRMLRTGFYTAAANQNTVPLPYDILFLKAVRRGSLLLRQYSAATDLTDTSCMEEGFIAKGDCLELTHPQTEATTYTVEYGQSIPGVSSSGNWVRDWFPDVMLYSILREVSIALKDRENGPVWDSQAERAIANLLAQGWSQNIAAGPKVRMRG